MYSSCFEDKEVTAIAMHNRPVLAFMKKGLSELIAIVNNLTETVQLLHQDVFNLESRIETLEKGQQDARTT